MKKIFDPDKTYAIALGGGGAKGAYEVGVWRSLLEEGLKYNAVSGTSVGALNGALMAMRDVDECEKLWSEIRYSKVMDVDDEDMKRIYSGKIKPTEFRPLVRKVINVVRSGGFDVTPLRNLLRQHIDPQRIKTSDVAFYAMTYSLTDKKPVEIDVRALPEEEICDMLLASAYFPAFKNEPLVGGKRYTDGGVVDSLPVNSLLDHGFTDVIAIRLTGGFGRERHVRPPKGSSVSYIQPTRKLGSTLNFTTEQSSYNYKLGYYDAKRFAYGLFGEYFYIDRTIDEQKAYDELMAMIRSYMKLLGVEASLRTLHEVLLPRMAKEYGAEGDYYDLLIKYLEYVGVRLGIPEFRIITDMELLEEVRAKSASDGADIIPRAFNRLA